MPPCSWRTMGRVEACLPGIAHCVSQERVCMIGTFISASSLVAQMPCSRPDHCRLLRLGGNGQKFTSPVRGNFDTCLKVSVNRQAFSLHKSRWHFIYLQQRFGIVTRLTSRVRQPAYDRIFRQPLGVSATAHSQFDFFACICVFFSFLCFFFPYTCQVINRSTVPDLNGSQVCPAWDSATGAQHFERFGNSPILDGRDMSDNSHTYGD